MPKKDSPASRLLMFESRPDKEGIKTPCGCILMAGMFESRPDKEGLRPFCKPYSVFMAMKYIKLIINDFELNKLVLYFLKENTS